MRSATRALLLASVAAASAGCGNYSTEDLRFLSALPYRQDLRVVVPADGTADAGTAGGLTAFTGPSSCADPGAATTWLNARETSDGLNAAVDWLVGLIDAVRKYPPTARDDDYRRWGPFDDENHAGREIQIVMERSWPDGEDGAPQYAYRFEARVKGTSPFVSILTGEFNGASASRGAGTLELFFFRLIALGMGDETTPDGTMTLVYDRASEPTTVDLTLTNQGFGVASFGYEYTGYANGSGIFRYLIVNGTAQLTVDAAWSTAKAGRARIRYVDGAVTGTILNCWDAAACMVYADDPWNTSCERPPCSTPALDECVGEGVDGVPLDPFSLP